MELILFVATIGANELHTKLWLAYISNDSDSSFVGFLGTLALGTAIVIITIEGNKKLKKDECDYE